jgi:hypothetical protein
MSTYLALNTRILLQHKVGTLCTRENTIQQLNGMFEQAKRIGNLTNIKKAKTKAGLKDVYFDAIMDQMANSYKSSSGAAEKHAALDAYVASLPHHVLSPVLRIRGMRRAISPILLAELCPHRSRRPFGYTC